MISKKTDQITACSPISKSEGGSSWTRIPSFLCTKRSGGNAAGISNKSFK